MTRNEYRVEMFVEVANEKKRWVLAHEPYRPSTVQGTLVEAQERMGIIKSSWERIKHAAHNDPERLRRIPSGYRIAHRTVSDWEVC